MSAVKEYTMSQQLIVAEEAENLTMAMMRQYRGPDSVIDVRKNSRYQNDDIDFIVVSKNGNFSVETKGDTYSTGNIFLETEVSSSRLDGEILQLPSVKLGWLYRSQADYIAYYMYQYDTMFLINHRALYTWFVRYSSKQYGTVLPLQIRSAKNVNARGEYYGTGFIVPLKALFSYDDIKKYSGIYSYDKETGLFHRQPSTLETVKLIVA